VCTQVNYRGQQNSSGQTYLQIELQNTNQLLLEFVNHSTATKHEKKHQTLKKDSVASNQLKNFRMYDVLSLNNYDDITVKNNRNMNTTFLMLIHQYPKEDGASSLIVQYVSEL